MVRTQLGAGVLRGRRRGGAEPRPLKAAPKLPPGARPPCRCGQAATNGCGCGRGAVLPGGAARGRLAGRDPPPAGLRLPACPAASGAGAEAAPERRWERGRAAGRAERGGSLVPPAHRPASGRHLVREVLAALRCAEERRSRLPRLPSPRRPAAAAPCLPRVPSPPRPRSRRWVAGSPRAAPPRSRRGPAGLLPPPSAR